MWADADAAGALVDDDALRTAVLHQLANVAAHDQRNDARFVLWPTAAEDLLEIFVRRHEAASTVITTNRPTQDWGQFLGDVPATTAILDRFLAHAEIIQMQGKSYRLHHRARHENGDGDRPNA